MTSIFIRTITIYIILNIMLKIMGKRQIGELEVNELVTTLLVSEIGALPISDTNIPLLPSLLPILFITSAEIIISVVKNKSAFVKRVIEGEPVYIIYKGRLRQSVLADNRISINEVLTEMRLQGIADISDVRYAILEQNGKISFLKENESSSIAQILVIDTKPSIDNIKEAGYDLDWVKNELNQRNTPLSNVFLMSVNESGRINIILKEEKK